MLVRPYGRIACVVVEGLAKPQTASPYLEDLAVFANLRGHTIGGEKIFLDPPFIGLLKLD